MIELVVHFNPVAAAERVARWSGVIRARLLMFVVALAISGAIWWWQHKNLGTWGLTLMIIVTALPLVWVAFAFVMEMVARRDLKLLREGVALVVDRHGVRVDDAAIPWPDVTKFGTRLGGPWRSPLYVIQGTDGVTHTLPLDYLDIAPADLDNAVRAYSGGTRWVDLAALGV